MFVLLQKLSGLEPLGHMPHWIICKSRLFGFSGVIVLLLLSGCHREPPKPPAEPGPQPREVINGFSTNVEIGETDPTTGFRLGGRCRYLSIRYAGPAKLEQVSIDCSLDFVDRRKITESKKFDSWEPGETKFIVFGGYLAVHYHWKGEAMRDGTRVTLAGNEGSHQ